MPDRKAKTRVVEAVPREAYCPICGTRPDTTASAVERFGEVFCSETHADEFTQAVRAARVQAAIARRDGACERGSGASAASGWTARLGRLLCWGGPALALVAMALILSGGGGLLLGAASGALPFLAALACPVGMYLTMRSMSKTGRPDDPDAKSQNQR
jgi:hypothetical protein